MRSTTLPNHRNVLGRASRRLRAVQTKRWIALHPETRALIEEILAQELTYISPGGLRDLAWAADSLDRHAVTGEIIEAGTALGGSAVVLARCKHPQRPMRVFDTFGLIPEPSERDGADVHDRYETILAGGSTGIAGETYYGYRDDLLAAVTKTMESFGIELERDRTALIQGTFQETLTAEAPVALAHVDADWYDSVDICLRTIHPAMVIGGRFVIDDYGSWSGAKQAVDDFLAGPQGRKYRREMRSRLHLVRCTP